MTVAIAHNADIEIAYEVFDPPATGRPLLLLPGLDGQMLWWPDGFCQALTAAGFHVARYDNRDSGLSTHFTSDGSMNAWKAFLVRGRRAPAYTADDMMSDALAVMDALGWDGAHLFGLSMGAGMGQALALRNPERVRTLTCCSSLPMGTPQAMLKHMKLGGFLKLAAKRYGKDRASQVRMLVDIMRSASSPGFPFDEDWAHDTAEACYDRRPPDSTARQRQLAAARASQLPQPGLPGISIPTLVIHGEADPLIKLSGGQALAAAIPRSRLVTFPGMGHTFPRELWAPIVVEVRALAQVCAVK